MTILKEGSTGSDVMKLQSRLKELGFNPGNIDGIFGAGTTAAVMGFQKSEALAADGIVGPQTIKALNLDSEINITFSHVSVAALVTPQIVAKMFPVTPIGNINENLSLVIKELSALDISDKSMVLVALATIRAETESFEPISEFKSRFNTSPNGHPFDLYDNRKDLGNKGAPDGAQFRGRGFIQLTGRDNYTKYSKALSMSDQLVTEPDLANQPDIAAKLLARFLKDKENVIREAVSANDLKAARKLVNGGSNGLDRFTDAFNIGNRLIPEPQPANVER